MCTEWKEKTFIFVGMHKKVSNYESFVTHDTLFSFSLLTDSSVYLNSGGGKGVVGNSLNKCIRSYFPLFLLLRKNALSQFNFLTVAKVLKNLLEDFLMNVLKSEFPLLKCVITV